MFRRLAEEGAAATRESLATAGPLDLVEASRRAFADFAPDIAGAAVFLDDGAAETAHYACGASFLLGLGATNVFALPDASAVCSTTSGVPTNGTNGTTNGASLSSSNDEDDRRRRGSRLASLVDVAGAPLPADAPVVIFTHRFLNVVAPDVVEVVRQRPETSRVFVATAATAEAHAADARAAARAAGASAAAANEIANDAKAKQERALRTAVTAILKTHDESHESHGLTHGLTRGRDAVTRQTKKKKGSGERADEDDAFAAADWGDWGSSEDDEKKNVELSRPGTSCGDPQALDALDALSLLETQYDTRATRVRRASIARSDEEEDEDEETKRRKKSLRESLESRFAAAYFPAPFVPLSAGAFVFPADSAAATASLRGSPEARQKDATRRSFLCPSYEDGTEEDGGDAPAPAGVGVLAATLAQFGFSACGFSRLECFAIGRVARAVARAVSAAGPPAEADTERRGTNGKPCALLLVDRVADVLTPALDEAFRGDDDDAFLAAALRISRRRCRTREGSFAAGFHSYPASFAFADFTFERSGNVGDCDDDSDFDHSRRRSCGTHEVTLPGAYAHPNDAEARQFADASTRRTLLETAIAARRWVADAAREEGVFLPSDTTPGEPTEASRSAEVSPAFLRSTLVPFLEDPRLRLRRGAMTHAVALVAACLEDRARERRLRESADACGEDTSDASERAIAFSFADAVREMTRDAGNAVAARAGEGAAAAAIAASLRRTLERSATTELTRRTPSREGETSAFRRRGLTRASAAVLAVAAYALAGEAAAFERRALGLGRVDFSSLNDEEEEDEEDFLETDARFRGAFRSDEKAKRDAARVASASPFGSRDESLTRDALADFVLSSFARSDQSETLAATNLAKNEESKLLHETLKCCASDGDCDWLGNDLAAKLAARLADSRDESQSRSLLEETRDGVERFLRRCGAVARARRRYASCGGLVDFAEAAVTANDASTRGLARRKRLDAHRSLAKELAERVSVGADGGGDFGNRFPKTDVVRSSDSSSCSSACDDVTHVASSLGGFLKHGVGNVLGSFGFRGGSNLVSKPKPSDSPTVLIFFLGGITAREIRDVRAAAANLANLGGFGEFKFAENGTRVEDILVGSTGLLRAEGEDLVGMVA